MKSKQHKDASIVCGVRVTNAVLDVISSTLAEKETFGLASVSKRFVAREIGNEKLTAIANASRKLKFYTFYQYLLIKDGDTIAHCFERRA